MTATFGFSLTERGPLYARQQQAIACSSPFAS